MAYDKSIFRKLNKGGLTQDAALLLATNLLTLNSNLATAPDVADPVADLDEEAELSAVIETVNELMSVLRAAGLMDNG